MSNLSDFILSLITKEKEFTIDFILDCVSPESEETQKSFVNWLREQAVNKNESLALETKVSSAPRFVHFSTIESFGDGIRMMNTFQKVGTLLFIDLEGNTKKTKDGKFSLGLKSQGGTLSCVQIGNEVTPPLIFSCDSEERKAALESNGFTSMLKESCLIFFDLRKDLAALVTHFPTFASKNEIESLNIHDMQVWDAYLQYRRTKKIYPKNTLAGFADAVSPFLTEKAKGAFDKMKKDMKEKFQGANKANEVDWDNPGKEDLQYAASDIDYLRILAFGLNDEICKLSQMPVENSDMVTRMLSDDKKTNIFNNPDSVHFRRIKHMTRERLKAVIRQVNYQQASMTVQINGYNMFDFSKFEHVS